MTGKADMRGSAPQVLLESTLMQISGTFPSYMVASYDGRANGIDRSLKNETSSWRSIRVPSNAPFEGSFFFDSQKSGLNALYRGILEQFFFHPHL